MQKGELELKYQKEEQFRQEIQQQERQLWEKIQSRAENDRKEVEMEKAAKAIHVKLPVLEITSFKRTDSDCITFENMFESVVDQRPISDQEKFGYL